MAKLSHRTLVLLILVGVILGGCSAGLSPHEKLEREIEEKLARLETVKGKLDIRSGPVSLQQELWVEPPKRLRTETEAGPAAFEGTIVVLNDSEGWFYSPALNMVTLADRSEYTPQLAHEAGAGSRLERMPAAVLDALRRAYAFDVVGEEEVARRQATHLEFYVDDDNPTFPRGPLHIWLDDEFSYPLAFRDSSGLEVRFSSVEFNRAIDPLTFEFVPPPGARVERVGSAQ